MERYLGLDVHAASSTLAVINGSGRRLQTHVLETNGRTLVEAVQRIPGRKHLVFEEGAQSAWLYEILSPHVEEAVVAGVAKSRGQEDDRRDAHGLAEKLRTGTLDRRIFKAPRVRDAPRAGPHAPDDRPRSRPRASASQERLPLARDRDARQSGLREDASGAMAAAASGHRPDHRRAALRADRLPGGVEGASRAGSDPRVPEAPDQPYAGDDAGIGTDPSRSPAAHRGHAHRFRTRQQFWSYCGLGIVMRSSSDWVRPRCSRPAA